MPSFQTFKTPLLLLTMGSGLVLARASSQRSDDFRSSDRGRRPNVIVILADDLGYTDLHAYGNKAAITPNIDALQKDGVRFTQAYSTAPICSPSRAGLVTGRYQQRFGFEFLVPQSGGNSTAPAQRAAILERLRKSNAILEPQTLSDSAFAQLPKGVPSSEITLGELFHRNGYKTAVIGKWHLGETNGFYPQQRGFDYHFGFYSGLTLYAPERTPGIVDWHLPWSSTEIAAWTRNGSNRLVRNNEPVEENQYLTDKLADEAIQYINANKEQPFLLYLPFNAPHDPFQAKQEDFDRYTNVKDTTKRVYYAMITALDRAVGRIRAQLKQQGIDKETIIFFISDNGGATYTRATDNKPLKGGKMTDFEGGIRVPFYAVYPGRLPAGRTYGQAVSSLDIYATAAAAAGIGLPADRSYDGVDLLPYLKDKKRTPHPELFWRNGYSKAVLKGSYKLYVNERNHKVFLYDIAADLSEKEDLSATLPDKVKELRDDLASWESQLKQPAWPNKISWQIPVDGELYPFPI